MNKEIWKDIKNHEEFYEVSTEGRVRNKKTGKIIVGDINSIGYERVILYKPIRKRYFKHRLVAEAFLGDIPVDYVVNHKNGIKTKNELDNLEIVSKSENDLHAFRSGLRDIVNRRKVAKVCIETGEILDIYDSILDASKAVGLKSPAPISCVLAGERKQYKGFYWKYV